MPITAFQKEVLLLLKKNRNPNSYLAGGIAINRAESSSRTSNDIDFFHDTDEAVTSAALMDRKVLKKAGFKVQELIEQPSFIRVIVSKKDQALRLEWVRDTAFRFFPVLEDENLGYRLHDADLAVNKCLALANRNEVRDIVDLIQFDSEVLSLTAICWAACGKDPGFTPKLLTDCMRRNSIIRAEELQAESLVKALSAQELKLQWLELLRGTEAELVALPPKDLGCLYLDSKGHVLKAPNPQNIKGKIRHFGSVGGAWPRIVAGAS
jgi:hypothetical protein